MTDELEQHIKKLESILYDLQTSMWDFSRQVENFDEEINDSLEMIRNQPADELNFLVASGFVPGVRIQINKSNDTYSFVGYSDGMRMIFEGPCCERRYQDTKSCVKAVKGNLIRILKEDK